MPTPDPLPVALRECRDAEDYFRLLGVEYDEEVLSVGRLHVLELFSRELAALAADTDGVAPERDPDVEPDLCPYRAALERAYAAFTDGGALRHRVFKVLRDRAPGQFVPEADLAAEAGLVGAGSAPAAGVRPGGGEP